MLQLINPIPFYFDRSGRPLDSGFVYIGETNKNPQTSPIAVYWDEEGTQPAAQPLRVINGYLHYSGKPAKVFVSQNAYSITVRDQRGALVFYDPAAISLADADLIDVDGISLTDFFKTYTPYVVANIEALRDVSKLKHAHAFVEGYYNRGDGGGGMYWYDSTDTTTPDDGGGVIVADDGARWKLIAHSFVSPLQFGADKTGADDCTEAFQNCGDYAINNGLEVIIPGGEFRLAGTCEWYSSGSTAEMSQLKITGVGASTKLVPEVAPMFKVGVIGKFLWGTQIGSFNVELAKDLFWSEGIISLYNNVEFKLHDINATGGNSDYTGLLIRTDRSYQGEINKCSVLGQGMILHDFTSSGSTTQEDSCEIIRCSAFYSFLGGIIRSAPGGRHNYHYSTFKHRVAGTATFANQFNETTLSVSAVAGDTTFTVSDSSKVAGAEYLIVGNSGKTELVKVDNVVGATVTCASPLMFDHSVAGTANDSWVINGAVGLHIGEKTYNITIDNPHFEQGAAGVIVETTRQLSIDDYFCSSRDLVNIRAGTGSSNVNLVTVGNGQLATNQSTAWGMTPPNQYCIRVTANSQALANKPNLLKIGRAQGYGSSTSTIVPWYNESSSVNNVEFIDKGDNSSVPHHVVQKPTSGSNVVCYEVIDGTTTKVSINTSGRVMATSLGVGNSASASTLGSVVKRIQFFDETGASIGYVPVYNTIS